MSLKLILYSAITIFFNGAVLRRYLKDELLLTGPYTLLILLPTITQPICQLIFGGFCGITLFAIASYRIYQRLPQRFIDTDGKYVFISGCDSGFGFAIAKALDEKGVHVFAGCYLKGQEGEQNLVKACSDRLVTIQLDVTSEESITNAVKTVQEKLQGKDLWALVNNAGIMYLGEAEIVAMTIYKRVMAVNHYGVVLLTQAFLPLLRRSKGRIVTMSSTGSEVAFPMLSAYCASKAACTSFMDALRLEMMKWDVSVSTIHPSGYATNLIHKETWERNITEILDAVKPGLLEEYGPNYKACYMKKASPLSLPSDLTPVVTAVDHALLAKSPLPQYIVGLSAEIHMLLAAWLPIGVSKYLVGVFLLSKSSISKVKNSSSDKPETPKRAVSPESGNLQDEEKIKEEVETSSEGNAN
ncbi:estradiol 17-beta-dehydrogenase 2-like [Apostichopus japonicus]|uniref:estradiol 17-beta-dehydrogenase 2-like n=1 Tax=Stichopus japonicus TaxID=307972 RepID=UPI003AB21FED